MTSPAAVPELQSEPFHNSSSMKRRQPDVDEREDDGKRLRLDVTEKAEARDHADGSPRDSPAESVRRIGDDKPADDREQRRRSTAMDEKQRGKRLFGALLGNLKQPSDRVSKRRQEIEDRRKAELQRQDDERLEDKQRRLDRLKTHRKNVQKTVDKENMRIRHHHMLNTANFLQTSAEPRLYYRPWDLRPDEEDRIADQLKDARAQVDSEVQSTVNREEDQQASTADEDHAMTNVDGAGSGIPADSEADIESAKDTADATRMDDIGETAEAQAKSAEDAQNKAAGASNNDTRIDHTDTLSPNSAADGSGAPVDEPEGKATAATDPHADDDGDHVVEGDEDTVIY